MNIEKKINSIIKLHKEKYENYLKKIIVITYQIIYNKNGN